MGLGDRTEMATKASVEQIGSKMSKVYICGDNGKFYRLVVKTNQNPKVDVELVGDECPEDGIVDMGE